MSPLLSGWPRWRVKSSPRSSRPRSFRPHLEELEPRLALSATAAFGVNAPVTTDPGVQQMPSIAADPHDSSHLVVAYLDYSLLHSGYAGIGVAVSHDHGDSWQHTGVPLPVGFEQGAADPIAHFDDQGHVFVSFAAATFLGDLPPLTDPGGGPPRALGLQADNGVFVARSDDGGLRWNQPVAVVSHLYDGQNKVPFEIKPDLAIDVFRTLPPLANGQPGLPNPNYGSLYEVWSRYYPAGQFPGSPDSPGGSDILFAVSHDAGQSWQTQLQPQAGTGVPVTVIFNINNTSTDVPEGLGHENWSHVTVGPEGDVYVSNFQGGNFAVHHSIDGGRSFTDADPTTNTLFPFGFNNNVVPSPMLSTNQFRTQNIRAIAADPLRPGTVYAAEAAEHSDAFGNILDEGDVIFARSTDYGVTWRTTFQVGGNARAKVLNDDNNGRLAAGRTSDVTTGQALPRLVTDAQGDVALIWYDTRRDPAGHLLDVFGTVSSDGGQTFSPNFRVTDQSFDADAGKFTDAIGNGDYYLGDFVGLALADHTAYAAWTDTRNGNQDVFFTRYAIDPPPAAANDRFESNDTAGTATDLGRVVTRGLPNLAIAPGDEDWFRVQAAATGSLTVTASLAGPGDSVRLELRDASGATLLAAGTVVRDASGQILGQTLMIAGQSGQTYLVRVLPGPEATAGSPARYTLDVRSLTADLGTQVYGVQSGSLSAGDQAYYALAVAAPGSLEVILTPGPHAQGRLHLDLLDPNNPDAVLASGQAAAGTTEQKASLAVTTGQAVYLHVFGDAGTQGDFTLTFINLDQFATPDNQTLFFPTGIGPSEAVLADLNGDGKLDIVVSHVGPDTVSVLLNNGDGTFQAPRDFTVGAFVQGGPSTLSGRPNFHRDLAVADFNRDGIPDIVVANHDSGDISVLFGRGDGTFAPQHRFNATAAPFALAVGDLNNDGIPDVAVVDSTAGPAQGAILLGRGDGTFLPPLSFILPTGEVFRTNSLVIADVNQDGNSDLVERDFVSGISVLLGNGDGTFRPAPLIALRNGPGLAVGDLNGDGKPDIVIASQNVNKAQYMLGNGDGSFQAVQSVAVGQTPAAVVVADFGSQVTLPDGSIVLGPPDGHPDLIVADNGLTQPTLNEGPPQIVVLPGLVDAQGRFAGFGDPIHLASAKGPLDVKVGDVNGDGVLDVVVVDRDGVQVIYGKRPTIPPNTTLQTARNLGTVVHIVEPTQTIVPGHRDAYYTLTVPTEAARGASDEILDFAGFFQALEGAGISMEVRDAGGNLLGSGERFRVLARQGQVLTLHVFGLAGAGGARGAGAYTLDIDVLPQVVSVEAQALLPGATGGSGSPGGPTTSLVVTLQGDRLDRATAENPVNYRISWLGPDGLLGTADDQVIAVRAETTGGQAAVYDPGANIDVATGKTYPTAVRQTVTLLFAGPLPTGSYRVELSPSLQAAAFNEDESGLLSRDSLFTGHPVVSVVGATVTEGDRRTAAGLVSALGTLADLAVWNTGTPFLTQFHDDLSALLDARLTALGDDPTISGTIDSQILDRFNPALGAPGTRPIGVLVIWLDPVPADLFIPGNGRLTYSIRDNSFVNTFSKGFVSVAGNVEVIVLPFAPVGVEHFTLGVDFAPPAARGGVIYFGSAGDAVLSLTAALRAGTSQFLLTVGEPAPPETPAPGKSAPPETPAPGKSAPPETPAPPRTPRDSVPEALPSVAALLSLPGARNETPAVTSITPLQGPTRPDVPPSRVATAAPGGDVALADGGGGGSDREPGTAADPRAQPLIQLTADLSRLFATLTARVQGWLRTFLIQFTTGDNRALGAPEAPEARQITPPGSSEKVGPLPIDGAGPVGASSERPHTLAGASLTAFLCLTGYFTRRSSPRSLASDVRKKHSAVKKEGPRRPDHAG
jgi:FG-GAP-like repeat